MLKKLLVVSVLAVFVLMSVSCVVAEQATQADAKSAPDIQVGVIKQRIKELTDKIAESEKAMLATDAGERFKASRAEAESVKAALLKTPEGKAYTALVQERSYLMRLLKGTK